MLLQSAHCEVVQLTKRGVSDQGALSQSSVALRVSVTLALLAQATADTLIDGRRGKGLVPTAGTTERCGPASPGHQRGVPLFLLVISTATAAEDASYKINMSIKQNKNERVYGRV